MAKSNDGEGDFAAEKKSKALADAGFADMKKNTKKGGLSHLRKLTLDT